MLTINKIGLVAKLEKERSRLQIMESKFKTNFSFLDAFSFEVNISKHHAARQFLKHEDMYAQYKKIQGTFMKVKKMVKNIETL